MQLTAPVRLVLKDLLVLGDPTNELKKGEGMVIDDEGTPRLAFGCPACGRVAYHTKLRFNKETNSLRPSVRCVKCQYHGWLKDGWFINEPR